MRACLLVVISSLAAACGGADCPAPVAAKPTSPAPPAAAPAGQFKMRSYFLVLLRRGPAWTPEKTAETKKLFEGHMANIQAMGKSGKLLVAGPTEADASDRDAIAGVFLFDVPTRDEVVALLQGDPAITAGRLVPEIYPWYGPAGLTYPGHVGPPK